MRNYRSAVLMKQKTQGFFADVLSASCTRFLLLHQGQPAAVPWSHMVEGVVEPYWLTLDRLVSVGVRLELPSDVTGIDGHGINAITGTAITVLPTRIT